MAPLRALLCSPQLPHHNQVTWASGDKRSETTWYGYAMCAFAATTDPEARMATMTKAYKLLVESAASKAAQAS
jgi:hypothetical protein